MPFSPTVSVIIPTFNRARFISEAIDSVLAQTFQDFEIIVVDDGSTDNTLEVIKPYLERYANRIKYIYQENRGPSAARNTGIKIAEGEYIAFLDSDDLWLPDKLEIQVKFMGRNPELGFCYSQLYIKYDQGFKGKKGSDQIFPPPYQTSFEEIFKQRESSIYTSTVMIRRKCLDDVGFFNEKLRRFEDYYLWIKLADAYGWKMIEKPLVILRRHEMNLSSIDDRISGYYYHIEMYKELHRNSNSSRIKRMAKEQIAWCLYRIGENYWIRHQYWLAFQSYLRSVSYDPFLGSRECRKLRKLIIPYIKCVILCSLGIIDMVGGKIQWQFPPW